MSGLELERDEFKKAINNILSNAKYNGKARTVSLSPTVFMSGLSQQDKWMVGNMDEQSATNLSLALEKSYNIETKFKELSSSVEIFIDRKRYSDKKPSILGFKMCGWFLIFVFCLFFLRFANL